MKRPVATQTKRFDAIEGLQKEFGQATKQLEISDEVKAMVMSLAYEQQMEFYNRQVAEILTVKVARVERDWFFQSFGAVQDCLGFVGNPFTGDSRITLISCHFNGMYMFNLFC